MVKLYDGGVYLVNGTEILADAAEVAAKTGKKVTKEEARKGTMVHPDAARGAVPPKSRYAPFRLTLMPSG